MARVFITGSADGLGQLAARQLVQDGHRVVLHARSRRRADEALAAVPGAADAVVGDLSVLAETAEVAAQIGKLGEFDAVIHNAAIGYQVRRRTETGDGLEHVFAVNTVAPYLLTALIAPPKRLVYLSSGMHHQGDGTLDDLQWTRRRWSGAQAYSDSKLHDVILAFAVARLWPDTKSNAVDPGWVATRMGGRGAPDDFDQGAATQAWLAAGDDPATAVTGQYFYHRTSRAAHPAASDHEVQRRLLAECARITGVPLS
ncbi:MAG: SDR family NAD(P)-dependent oxidoreductase [Kibdelosporangium sp.]